jgi:hypothetical protein
MRACILRFRGRLLGVRSGAGPIGAIGVGAVIGGATFGTFQLAFGLARSAAAHLLVALVLAAPAAFAGYHVVCGCAVRDILRRLASRFRRCERNRHWVYRCGAPN